MYQGHSADVAINQIRALRKDSKYGLKPLCNTHFETWLLTLGKRRGRG